MVAIHCLWLNCSQEHSEHKTTTKDKQTAEECVVKKDKKGLLEISEEMNGSKSAKEAGEEQTDKFNTARVQLGDRSLG